MRKKIIEEATLRKLYCEQGLSLRKMSEKLKRPVSAITKYMDQYGIERRTKSDAQKGYLSDNDHPMQGKHHTEEAKKKISASLGDFWDSLDPDQRAEYRQLVGSGWRKRWASMSNAERENMIASLNAANRQQQGHGSRFERFLADELRSRGYVVEERSNNYIANAKQEVDLALTHEGIMIEVDGPTHFMPIYGEEALERQEAKDADKDDYLISAGFSVLRIQDNNGPLSQVRIEKIVTEIERIKKTNGKCRVWIMRWE